MGSAGPSLTGSPRGFAGEIHGRRLVDGLGGGVEGVDDVGGDATASGHVVSVTARPFPNGGTLLAVDRGAAFTRGGSAAPATTAYPAAGFHPRLERIAEFRGVFTRKVDLVGHTVDCEFDSFVGGTFTIKIINQGDGYFFRHSLTEPFYKWTRTGRAGLASYP